MDTRLVVKEQSWAGLLEVPARHAGWAAGPVRITGVRPLKTGQGRLVLDYIRPLAQRHDRRQSIELRVIQHGPEHLVGSLKNADGSIGTMIVSTISFEWLANYSMPLLDRWPRAVRTAPFLGALPTAETIETYLDRSLGRSDDQIEHGAMPCCLGATLQTMPARSIELLLNVTYRSFDAWRISRGFVPQEMEDRWFIMLADGHLRFYRSWTGSLIYDVDAVWHGDDLHLGVARVNRDPKQYSETNDRHDMACLKCLIDELLLGLRSSAR